MNTIYVNPITLGRMTAAQTADATLREMGCTLSPAHDRLWLVPAGKMRAARRIARENQYPVAFRTLSPQQDER